MAEDHVERFIATPDGLRLFLRDYGAAPRMSAGTVFCLHGLTRNSADFERVAPYVAKSGWRVLAMDVRGRGRSDRDPDPSRYHPDTYARDVLHVLDTLAISEAVFIGTSMGGLITAILAAAAPARIKAAILNDVGPVLNPAGLARIAGYVGNVGPYQSWEEFTAAIRAAQTVAFPDADQAFWRTFARRVGRERSDGRVIFDYDPAIAQAFVQPAGVPDLPSLFAALANKPTLVLRGELSDILTPEGVNTMRQLNAQLIAVEVPRVGHAPSLDEPIAREAIQSFLQGLPQGC